MVVQHNLSAMNANRYLGINNSKLSKSLEKLSSGYAINRAGDNAAGLAVSEKMRSQIAGMTQGVKNAQDGISMVQTFEGALTETDSILQRMKTLADQMANGTYDDPVDRSAAQLEFDQLNDELNQIADTDFNGVICLNGGVMADGLEQVDGKFDYSNAASQLQAKKDAIKQEIADVKASTPEDVGDTTKWNSVDDIGFNAANAAQMWKDMGLGDDVKDVDITFTWDGTAWKATSAKAYDGLDADGADVLDTTDKNVAMDDDKKGTLIEDAEVDLSKIKVATAAKGKGTGEGGFTVSTSASAEVANAVFDATDLKVGDTVTLNFANPSGKTYAPKNMGLTDDSLDELNGKFTLADGKGVISGGGVTTVTDQTMNQDWKTVFDDLSGVTLDLQVQEAATPAAAGVSATIKTATVTGASGKVYGVAIANDKITISNQAAIGGIAASTSLVEIDLGKFTQVAPVATPTNLDTTIKLAFDNYNAADPTKVPDVSMTKGEPDTAAIDAKVAELNEKLAALDDQGVSVSNAYGKGDIPMTYTDTVTLQTGARSKDAVKFTFAYTSGGIGDLLDNMNCSARADGLNTESLSLATAEDANNAIDKIDHAINKVSMVRATFGAIQNRLEHKIDNLNVSIENLTSAESQIRDTNMPQEMMNFTKQQILAQASQSMLAQANQLPQGVLSLLQ